LSLCEEICLAGIVFYEKPGCGTNARQKRLLEAAGHTVIARNLLAEPWTSERLRGFFGDAPVAEWFNVAAPRVKSSEIDLWNMTVPAALALMLADPLLIRRPLIDWEGQKCSGFEGALVASLLGDAKASQSALVCGRAKTSSPLYPTPDEAMRRVQR
jgi:nitrogenase-associated protein